MKIRQRAQSYFLVSALIFAVYSIPATCQGDSGVAQATAEHDGSHDFDFLIGDWKAHVRVLRNRLDGSNDPKDWVEYEGISNHKKLLDSNANFEEFDAYCAQLHKRNKGQILRRYNPETHQWSIYLVDLDKGTLDLPPVVGQFTDNRGEFYTRTLTKAELFTSAMCG